MAGEWIKMRTNLWDDPRVSQICDETGVSEAAVVGALYWLWASADEHTEDGVMHGLSLSAIDRKTGVKGMGQALHSVGWIDVLDGGIEIKRFSEHNGESAKSRAQTAKRVARHKGNAKVTVDALPDSNDCVTTALPREEKRREHKEQKQKITPSPDGDLLDGIDSQVASDFKALRTKLKAPITQTAMNGISREAGKAGISLEAALTMCCERGWRGFKADWVIGNQSGSPPGGRPEKFNPTAYANRNRSAP